MSLWDFKKACFVVNLKQEFPHVHSCFWLIFSGLDSLCLELLTPCIVEKCQKTPYHHLQIKVERLGVQIITAQLLTDLK